MDKFFIVFNIFVSFIIYSQERKTFDAVRFDSPPIIDGILNDNQWTKSKKLDDFILALPETRYGKKIPVNYESTAFFGYDNNAIYIAAILKHPNMEKIQKELAIRDEAMLGDFELFWVSIDPYDNKEGHYGFSVSNAGVINDGYFTREWDKSGFNYDTVFDAKVSLNEENWTVEMIIPYSALRFPKSDLQNWGINFSRRVQDFEETYTWNPTDIRNFSWPEKLGLVKNLKSLNPPVRLFLYPYLQSALNLKNNNTPLSAYSAGLDLKYGLTNSFTLDLTLIPDFGQVTFDDEELNLGPFEQQFDENRAFFSEGASLFEKADIGFRAGNFFYSRRIGQKINFNESDYLRKNEELLSYENKPKLLNSVKITGTTEKKLSIGIINAITDETYAYFKNNNGEERKEIITPLSNYNVISLTQEILNDVSSISLLNTNVNRKKGANSNNTALVANIFDNKRKYNIQSAIYGSSAPRFSEKNGFRGYISAEELNGNFQFFLHWTGVDKYYNQNELGYFTTQNSQRVGGRVSYRILEDNKLFRGLGSSLYVGRAFRFDDGERIRTGIRFANMIQLQNLSGIGFVARYTDREKDYYETRNNDKFIFNPPELDILLSYSTNDNKKIYSKIEFSNITSFNEQFNEKKTYNRYELDLNFRFSNQISAEINSQLKNIQDDIGYIMEENNDIYFGIRDLRSIENSIEIQYKIDSKKNIFLNFRNFWSTAAYDEKLFKLKKDGYREISDYGLLDENPNTNFNLWNLDLNFEWWFANGSNLVLLYRNQIFNRNNEAGLDYYKSLKKLFDIPIEHQLSLRINYLIDVNRFKKNNTKTTKRIL